MNIQYPKAFVSRAMGLSDHVVNNWDTRGIPRGQREKLRAVLEALPPRTTVKEMRAAMRVHGISGAALAKGLGISRQSIAKWKKYVPLAREKEIRAFLFMDETISMDETAFSYRKHTSLLNQEREMQKTVLALKSGIRGMRDEAAITSIRIDIQEMEARLAEVREQILEVEQYI